MSDDGKKIYDRSGGFIGTIHYSARSRRWYTKQGSTLSPSRFFDAQEAADSLRGVGIRDAKEAGV